MTKPKTGATAKKKQIPKPPILEVEDSDSLPEFLNNAKSAWKNYHRFRIEKRGRPSVAGKVFWAIDKARLSGELKGKPSQGKTIRVVKDILQNELKKQPAPSEDTIRPYVKVWHLAKFKGKEGLTPADWSWLEDKRKGFFWDIFWEIIAWPEAFP